MIVDSKLGKLKTIKEIFLFKKILEVSLVYTLIFGLASISQMRAT